MGLRVAKLSDPELKVPGVTENGYGAVVVGATVPLEIVPGTEYGADEERTVFELDEKAAVEENGPVVLMLPTVGPADEDDEGIELLATVNEPLRLDTLRLEVPEVALLGELENRGLVV